MSEQKQLDHLTVCLTHCHPDYYLVHTHTHTHPHTHIHSHTHTHTHTHTRTNMHVNTNTHSTDLILKWHLQSAKCTLEYMLEYTVWTWYWCVAGFSVSVYKTLFLARLCHSIVHPCTGLYIFNRGRLQLKARTDRRTDRYWSAGDQIWVFYLMWNKPDTYSRSRTINVQSEQEEEKEVTKESGRERQRERGRVIMKEGFL